MCVRDALMRLSIAANEQSNLSARGTRTKHSDSIACAKRAAEKGRPAKVEEAFEYTPSNR